MTDKTPRIVVFCSLFPSSAQPNSGVFIRERMFRVGQQLPIVVVSPVAWFPLQGLIRFVKPGFRPQPPKFELQQGVEVYYPRFLSIPGLLKQWDGFMMALGSLPIMVRLKRKHRFNLIDAHFAYPDGYAATWLGKWFKVPVTITLRGTEVSLSKFPARKLRIVSALQWATKIFSVADSLKRHVVALGIDSNKIQVVGNGVDADKFQPVDRAEARRDLNLPEDAPVLISVGGLVDRKGYHRVIEVLPLLLKEFPDLMYLIVGGACAEGNNRKQLEQQVADLNLQNHVRFLGPLPSEQLKSPLSASDVFVLSTANEGWANVFLEAMACGLPVITTDVGGNSEVVNDASLGTIVPFGDASALRLALSDAFNKRWDRQAIRHYAEQNAWHHRVDTLVAEFKQIIEKTEID
ncbi:glycosyltransferase [Methylotuvimicrobium buryatense]|uniref:Glycosyltransferase family 4 protein n=1 Tax=Methylotuvimicrobium buryatense TaxID=95641 RepID=A0A4P9UQW8_METBY|nr:glycosyltransferase [Methylotuvimicrobium buryatense]QCW82016.1 glycosyltransferase family 4 protein [Methylotuvimicrobium buryatense]